MSLVTSGIRLVIAMLVGGCSASSATTDACPFAAGLVMGYRASGTAYIRGTAVLPDDRSTDTADVPIIESTFVPIVSGSILGSPGGRIIEGRFAVDTGFTGSLLLREGDNGSELHSDDRWGAWIWESARGRGRAAMVGGSVSTTPAVVRELTIGGGRVYNVPAALTPRLPIPSIGLDGLIGLGVLTRYKAVEIDFATRALSLYRSAAFVPAIGEIAVPMGWWLPEEMAGRIADLPQGIGGLMLTTNLEIEGVSFGVVIDTGSTWALAIGSTQAKSAPWSSTLVSRRERTIESATGRIPSVEADCSSSIRFAGTSLLAIGGIAQRASSDSRSEVLVYDDSSIPEGLRPPPILGFPVFQRFSLFRLDFQHDQLVLIPQ